MNAPPAKASGFRLRLKAGLIGHSADCSLSQNRGRGGGSRINLGTYHPSSQPSPLDHNPLRGERKKQKCRLKGWDFKSPI